MYSRTLTLEDVDFNYGKISNYKGKYTSIIIPEYFKVNRYDIRLTSIGFRAFYRKNLTSVIIPNTVNEIEGQAFFINNLSGITIPRSVTILEFCAFNCNVLKEVNGVASKGIIYARSNDGTDDYSKIVSYGGKAKETDFIPGTVTTIGNME